MMNVLSVLVIVIGLQMPVFGAALEMRHGEYLAMLKSHPDTLGPEGSWEQGEIEIITDVRGIYHCEKATGRQVGVVAKDKYWMWINDAVRFPSGSYGVYGRFLWTHSLDSNTGVAVLPVTAEKKVILNCNYRHATRAWELELPRGTALKGEDPMETARREVIEETGMVIAEVQKLGEMATDTGVTNAVVPIFIAEVMSRGEAHPEDSEAIEGTVSLGMDELVEALLAGEMKVNVNGRVREAKMRDPFLTYALLLAQMRKHPIFDQKR